MNYRGMVDVALGSDGKIVVTHKETTDRLAFNVEDLDEVIGVLIDFRAAMQAGRVEGVK
ncbi:MAG: hypothetical protein ABIU95_15380 [Burkholderiales bacterium]